MKTEMTPQEAEAIRTAVRETLDAIGEARAALTRACSLACPLQGWSDHWLEISALADDVQSLWHLTRSQMRPLGHDGFGRKF